LILGPETTIPLRIGSRFFRAPAQIRLDDKELTFDMARLRFALGVLMVLGAATAVSAQTVGGPGTIVGTVVDALGGTVSNAAITLIRDGQQVATATSDTRGEFTFDRVPEGRYQLQGTAAGFDTRRSDPTYVGTSARVTVQLQLAISPLQQDVVVTATATPTSEAQVGAPVTVLDATTLDALGKVDVFESLRTVPGVQVVQTGPKGGTASVFVRGGNSNFNKVLIDGVPANDIGGSFDFAQLSTTGVDRVEVMRGSNSILFGSDAMTGVISLSTPRGRTRVPEASYSIDGGNLGTLHQDASVGGTIRRFDYFSEISHFATDNEVPNNAYRNTTYAGRFGVILGSNTDVSGTIRRIDTSYGSPNSFNYFALADDSIQDNGITYASISAQSQINERLRTTVRFGSADQTLHFVNPTPTGEPVDPFGFGANYLGNTVTITGANGYRATGRAILDFSGAYPQVFDSTGNRRLLNGEVDYALAPGLDIAGGARYEHEHGTSDSGSLTETTRNNGGGFVEGRLSMLQRLYVSGGVGLEHNTVFGNAATPRVSVAAYLRNPSSTESLGDTKLTFNAGKGIKEPSLFQEQSSLFFLIPPGSPAAAQVPPIGPERSRSIDVGLEQGFWRGRGRARIAYYNNEFHDLIEYVSKSVLPQLGIPVEVANATPFGAYVNSQSFKAQGVELSGDAVAGPVRITASYQYLDATVTTSLSDGALSPAFNPTFPDVPIGAFSPLVGARPFRRPTNSGNVAVIVNRGAATIGFSAFFSGKQDDSTFLSDEFFGNSMLLPNKDMDAAYQKVDLSGGYRIHRRIRWYISIENLFDQAYEAAAGFPGLPRTIRTGLTVGFGTTSAP